MLVIFTNNYFFIVFTSKIKKIQTFWKVYKTRKIYFYKNKKVIIQQTFFIMLAYEWKIKRI